MRRFKRQRLDDGRMMVIQQINPTCRIEIIEAEVDLDGVYISQEFQNIDYTLIMFNCESDDIDKQFHILKKC